MIKGNLLDHAILKSFDIDLVIVLIIFLMAFAGEDSAGIFAFGQGLIMDIFSGGVLGLFTLIYMVIFIGIKFASRPLDLTSTGGQIVIVSIAVLFKEFLMIALLYLFSLEISFSITDLAVFIFSAICSGLIAPLLFYLLHYFSDRFVEIESEV